MNILRYPSNRMWLIIPLRAGQIKCLRVNENSELATEKLVMQSEKLDKIPWQTLLYNDEAGRSQNTVERDYIWAWNSRSLHIHLCLCMFVYKHIRWFPFPLEAISDTDTNASTCHWWDILELCKLHLCVFKEQKQPLRLRDFQTKVLSSIINWFIFVVSLWNNFKAQV